MKYLDFKLKVRAAIKNILMMINELIKLIPNFELPNDQDEYKYNLFIIQTRKKSTLYV